jgi:gamma-glutamyltranspeptidase
MTDNLWKGSKSVGIRAGVAHLLVTSELLVCSDGGAKLLRRGGCAASISLEAAVQVREVLLP